MTKPGDKNWLPHEDHLRRLPKKRIASAAFLFNEQREVLIVKPEYKDFWILPGGIIELNESPIEGLQREIQEELGLKLTGFLPITIQYSRRADEAFDVIHILFKGPVLTQELIHSIVLQKEELEQFQFIPLQELPKFSKSRFMKYWSQVSDAIQRESLMYIENIA